MELLKKIEEQGHKQIQQVLADAEAEARNRLSEAERQIHSWREEYLKQAAQQIESEKRLIWSRARARAREAVLRAKGHAAEQLFEQLSKDVASFRTDAAKYRALLTHCLRQAEREIPGPLILHIDPQDEPIAREILTGTSHTIGGSIKTLGGFIATNQKGDLLIDNRLETRIANLRQRYRPELSQALFDRAQPR
jgi:vacuolar-type H+-ATPase subunit E/Vma4